MVGFKKEKRKKKKTGATKRVSERRSGVRDMTCFLRNENVCEKHIARRCSGCCQFPTGRLLSFSFLSSRVGMLSIYLFPVCDTHTQPPHREVPRGFECRETRWEPRPDIAYCLLEPLDEAQLSSSFIYLGPRNGKENPSRDASTDSSRRTRIFLAP